MKVVNPIYARAFASDFSAHLSSLGAQKIKHSHLLSAYEMLAKTGFAFIEGNNRKLDAATACLYHILQERSARVSRKNVYEAAKASLFEKYRSLRIPCFVDQCDAHKTEVCQGAGKDDAYWYETQWVDWIEEKANSVLSEARNLKGLANLTSEELRNLRHDVIADFLALWRLVDQISESPYGAEALVNQQSLLNETNQGMQVFLDFFKQQIRILDAGLPPKEETPTLTDMAVAFRLQGLNIADHIVGQDLSAMARLPDSEAQEVLKNSRFKIRLALE